MLFAKYKGVLTLGYVEIKQVEETRAKSCLIVQSVMWEWIFFQVLNWPLSFNPVRLNRYLILIMALEFAFQSNMCKNAPSF